MLKTSEGVFTLADGPAPESLPKSNEIHIWTFGLADRDREQLATSLTTGELARFDRMGSRKAARHFASSLAVIRSILGSYLGADPRDVPIVREPRGKPRLDSSGDIRFNNSHSGDYGVLAVTVDRDIGVDLEKIRFDRKLEAIARRFYTASERARIEQSPAAERVREATRVWTRKEAYMKLTGLGLGSPISRLDTMSELLETTVFHEFDVGDSHVATVAVAGTAAVRVSVREWR